MLKALLDTILPRRCTVCDSTLIAGEDVMCLDCLMKLPATRITDYCDNVIHERLVSLRPPLAKAAACFYYRHESQYVRLIHDTKYNGRPRVGRTLARMHARELAADGFFEGIDMLMPVPLHPLKEFMRGYNQSREIALGLSEVSGLPVADNLRADGWHGSQTRLNARLRRLNARGRFKVVDAGELEGMHLLVVDDVITTGSTVLAALEALHRASPGSQLSVYSLTLTQLA